MAKTKKTKPLLLLPAPKRRPLIHSFATVFLVLLLGIAGLAAQLKTMPNDPEPSPSGAHASHIAAADIQHDLYVLSPHIKNLVDQQTSTGAEVVNDITIQNDVSAIQFDLSAQHYRQARQELDQLDSNVGKWQKQLDDLIAARKAAQEVASKTASPPAPPGFSITAPIIIYHYTPPDFESQLQYLIAHNYTTIDMDQLAAGLGGAKLPAKPIVLTFDDGFSNQMQAFALLKKYNMKATFYIIDAGEASKWCIGAGRRYDQGYSCGDGYLTWDDVRQLDASGLITIASHTVDHLNLASQPLDVQRFQIFEGKRQLEAQLGHPVRHFAYPYGSYSGATISLVKEAGFVTAVSTLPGTIHTPGSIYTLHRARVVYSLP